MPYPLEVLAWTSAAIIAVGVIWSKGIVPTGAWIRRTVTQTKRALEIIETLSDIAGQFRPNGGTSLHDKIVRIEADVVELKHAVKVVQEEEMAALNLMLAQVLSDTGELKAIEPNDG